MSLLDGGIASIMQKAFAGIYLPATLYRRTMTYDAGGSPTATETQRSCRAQVDSATEAMRQSPGYTEQSVAIYVLKNTLDATPTTDDEIVTTRGRFAIGSIDTDPGNSYWLIRGDRA